MTTLMIHQPHFLPWYPYFARFYKADVVVMLDDVLFRKNYYQNRTKLLENSDQFGWYQLPILRNGRQFIGSTKFSQNLDAHMNKMRRKLSQNYSKFPFFDDVYEPIDSYLENISQSRYEDLATANIRGAQIVFELLGFPSKHILRSSELITDADSPTTRLTRICQSLNAKKIVTGHGVSTKNAIHNHSEISKFGIDFEVHPMRKPSWEFHEGISILHWMFVYGPEIVARKMAEDK